MTHTDILQMCSERTVEEDHSHLRNKRAGLVVMSQYPYDARPRYAADALVREGMSVDYICATDGEGRWYEKTSGLRIFRVPLSLKRGGKLSYAYQYSAFISASAAMLALLSLHRRYDLIYINNMPDILVASALLPRLLGAKVILDMHDPMPELMATIFKKASNSKSVQLIKCLEKWSIACAHQLLTPNHACKRIVAERSCPAEKVAVMMNSPDASIFPFRPALSRAAPTLRGNRPFVMMYHGTLVERNGIDLAVEALAEVCIKIPTAQLHIYGKTTPFLTDVLQSARNRGLDKNIVHFGLKPLEEIVAAIGACDVGIIPNHRNAFTDINTPTRIFEFLALGKPVIAPRTPGIQDYFDEESLLFFNSGDAKQLAEQIQFVAFNPESALSLTERGQQVYTTHLWEQERRTLIDVVSKLLRKSA